MFSVTFARAHPFSMGFHKNRYNADVRRLAEALETCSQIVYLQISHNENAAKRQVNIKILIALAFCYSFHGQGGKGTEIE